MPFVGRFNIDSRAEQVAADIRQTLRISQLWHQRSLTRDKFYRELVRRAETNGITVLRNSVVGNNTHRQLNSDEFQGFAISDRLAPLIFINQSDYRSAQIFTFAHELVHVWMGLSGVSHLDYFAKPSQQVHDAERITDAAAAETLVPADDFDLRWDAAAGVGSNLQRLAGFYRVSSFVILRRAYELNRITFDVFRKQHDDLLSKILPRRKTGGGGGRNAIFARNGVVLTTTILYSLMEGRISPSLASELLNIRIVRLRGLEDHLARREIQYA